jgi:hypothetical protein
VAADDLAGIPLREIDPATFAPVPTVDGGWVPQSERWLRGTVVPRPDAQPDAGSGQDEAATMTPIRQLELRLESVDSHVARLPTLLSELEDIVEEDGTPVIAQEGVEDARADNWTQTLVATMTTVRNHRDVYNNRYGSLAEPEEDESDLQTDGEAGDS